MKSDTTVEGLVASFSRCAREINSCRAKVTVVMRRIILVNVYRIMRVS